jgi:PEGA domain
MPGTLHDGKTGASGQGVNRLWRWAALAILMPTFGLTVARSIDRWPRAAGEARAIVSDVVRRPGETLAAPITAIAGPLVDVPGDISHASLSLRSTPAADVWIDGKAAGRTPIDGLSVSLGPHEVRFHRDGYRDRVHEVVATRAQPIVLSVDLTQR